MIFSNYIYEPTDIEDEVFLSDIPLEIIKKSIETQFDDPLEYKKKDYVNSFITKYNYSKDNLEGDELESLDEVHDKFIMFMLKIFDSYLDVGINEIDTMDEDDQHELIHLTYRFFIKNIKKNFVTLITNYIEQNKEELCDNCVHKKDVTTMTFKAEIDNDEDITILSNLGSVINYILSIDFGVDEFLDLCIDDSHCLETEYVKKKYDEFILVGNFVEKYVKMVDSNFRIELESKVRNRILRKYPIRKKPVIKEETE